MSLDHRDMRLTIRTHLATLSVAATGDLSLAASGSTYTRTTGSFLSDGFEPGMEVLPAGFVDNGLGTVVEVTALTLKVDRAIGTEGAAGSRSLTAGLPANRSWENMEFRPDGKEPYVEEQFIPGPNRQRTLGPGGTLETLPMYQVKIHVPAGTGPEAADRYADAILALFAPRTALTLSNGDTLRARTDAGPYRGQLLQRKPGWATVPVTIPFRLDTVNP